MHIPKIKTPKEPPDSSTQDAVVRMRSGVRELQPEERFWAVISALTKATFFFFFLSTPTISGKKVTSKNEFCGFATLH